MYDDRLLKVPGNDLEDEILQMLMEQDGTKGRFYRCYDCAPHDVADCNEGCNWCDYTGFMYTHKHLAFPQPLSKAIRFRQKHKFWQGDRPTPERSIYDRSDGS